jgi:hypothetical protein
MNYELKDIAYIVLAILLLIVLLTAIVRSIYITIKQNKSWVQLWAFVLIVGGIFAPLPYLNTEEGLIFLFAAWISIGMGTLIYTQQVLDSKKGEENLRKFLKGRNLTNDDIQELKDFQNKLIAIENYINKNNLSKAKNQLNTTKNKLNEILKNYL